ncbi:dihydrodipicolinate synthase family protein [Parabacteroides gordonii]|jgi:N-acetylneuraminate lyase|uniref:dihydrodipicolinate synthase family protein n=1 Tax=Parabacteroides gordonii TaxID=574930 RepID=UPI00241DAFB4|nr:dihydrodipicolinate synthase family protein [Parabacteroides gordonii]
MKNYQRLKGLIAASFTPMDAHGKVNLFAIDKYADLMAESGMTGVFVCGTTGESLSLTTEERKSILEQWIKSANHRFKVIAHVGSNSQFEAIELARHAAKAGADAIASMAPCFFKPESVKELIAFFAPIAESAKELPFYYYNMPSMTGVSLSVAAFLEEGKKVMPNLAGTKFTHNNLMEMGECLALNNGEFEVLHGYDEILISGLAFGAVAGVGSTYNYLPDVYHGILKAMEEGDMQKARELQMKSIEIVKIIIKYGGGVRGGKAIMNLIGIECGQCRLPISPVSDEEYDMLKNDLYKIGFLPK